MKQRNVAAVLFLSIITFGIYTIVWFVKTKNEMNKLGAQIPTAWLIIIPFVSLWWMWKYSEGVEKVTGGKMSTVMSFVLLFLLSIVGMMILQYEFNKAGTTPEVAAAGPAPNPEGAAPAMPTPVSSDNLSPAQPMASPTPAPEQTASPLPQANPMPPVSTTPVPAAEAASSTTPPPPPAAV
jgi:hypothetical protein